MNKYRIENPNNKDVREYKSRTTGYFFELIYLSKIDKQALN
jgi:hypothetical protein